jgi:hypothetical protein
MTFKNTFPIFYSYTADIYNNLWESEYDILEVDLYEDFVDILEKTFHQIAEGCTTEELKIKVHSIFDEIILLKQSTVSKPEKERLAFTQLIWGLISASEYNFRGEFHYCFAIFFKSLFNKVYDNFEQYDLNEGLVLFQFLLSKDPYLLQHANHIVESWLNQLYYYSRSFSGLNDWGHFFFPLTLKKIIHTNLYAVSLPLLLSNMYVWAEINGMLKEKGVLIEIINRFYRESTWTEEQKDFKKNLALQLILSKDIKDTVKEEISLEVHQNVTLSPLEELKIITALSSDQYSLQKNFASIIAAIKNYNYFLLGQDKNSDRITLLYEKSRIFKVIFNPVLIALSNGQHKMAVEILSEYYNCSVIDPDTILFIVPNEVDGLAYYVKNKRILNPYQPQATIHDVTSLDNNLLTSYRMLRGQGDKQKFEDTGKATGTPVPKYSKPYLETLLKFYNFSLLKPEIKGVTSTSQFAFNSLPLQAIMAKQLETVLPINLSLLKKQAFNPACKILFWKGNSISSQREMESLLAIFQNTAFEIDILEEGAFGKTELFDCIKKGKHDIIWISSHGAHDHHEPNMSHIVLSDDEKIELREFEQLNQGLNKRRLLFFNTCEGGLHTETGEFKNVGFAELLTNNYQDVLGHLWMVEYRAGMVYGILYGIGLHRGMNFIEAYQFTMLAMISGKTTIIDVFQEYGLTDIVDLLNNADSYDWESILTWGSSAYYI